MSLLSIIQNVCEDLGIAKPTTVVGNTDTQVAQLLQIANREGDDLASRYPWQRMIRENTFTISTGSRDQGLINGTVVTDSDFDYLLNDTIWNRTLARPIFGPQSARDRQTLKAFPVTGPFQEFWIQEGKLFIDPAPTSADSAAFEYKSTWWCEDSGGSGQSTWAADTDVGRLDEKLMELGVTWRWRKRKGLEYAEDFNAYETRVANAMARDGGKKRLSMNARPFDQRPGIFVPTGNWNL